MSRKIVPNVKQKTELSCGCACVESVAKYWGIDIEQPEPEEYGFSPGDISRELIKLGFRIKAGYFDLEDLEMETYKGRPPIVLISSDGSEEMSHWVVIASFYEHKGKKYVSIMNPTSGRKERIAIDKFDETRVVEGHYKFAIVASLETTDGRH